MTKSFTIKHLDNIVHVNRVVNGIRLLTTKHEHRSSVCLHSTVQLIKISKLLITVSL